MGDYSNEHFIEIFKAIEKKDALVLENPPTDEEYKDEERQLFLKRNQKYNELIEAYRTSYEQRHITKNKLKKQFFWIIMPIYMIVVVVALFILVAALFINNVGLGIILSAVTTLLTTIIAIPTIIANYLFPKKEDDNLLEMIGLMSNFDNKYYDRISRAKEISNKQ